MADIRQIPSADGTPIAYRAVGSGEPVLLVHGTTGSSADWTFVLPFLRDRFTVVTLDRRGRGESGDGPEYAMEREAEDVLAVLDAVGAEMLVGHSCGALCSILAAQRTDRLRRLVLYEPPHAVKAAQLGGISELIAEGALETALERFLPAAGTTDAQLLAIRSSPAWPVLLDAMPTVPRELDAAAGWRHPEGPIDVPTLFLLGGETRGAVYLDGLEDLLAAFTDLRQERIPGQQHFGNLFAAEFFAGLIADFCAQS